MARNCCWSWKTSLREGTIDSTLHGDRDQWVNGERFTHAFRVTADDATMGVLDNWKIWDQCL